VKLFVVPPQMSVLVANQEMAYVPGAQPITENEARKELPFWKPA
jgi:hypothetical protein